MKFQNKESFLSETQNLSKQFKNIKLSTLRDGIARTNGFKSTKSYIEHLDKTQAENKKEVDFDSLLTPLKITYMRLFNGVIHIDGQDFTIIIEPEENKWVSKFHVKCNCGACDPLTTNEKNITCKAEPKECKLAGSKFGYHDSPYLSLLALSSIIATQSDRIENFDQISDITKDTLLGFLEPYLETCRMIELV